MRCATLRASDSIAQLSPQDPTYHQGEGVRGPQFHLSSLPHKREHGTTPDSRGHPSLPDSISAGVGIPQGNTGLAAYRRCCPTKWPPKWTHVCSRVPISFHAKAGPDVDSETSQMWSSPKEGQQSPPQPFDACQSLSISPESSESIHVAKGSKSLAGSCRTPRACREGPCQLRIDICAELSQKRWG